MIRNFAEEVDALPIEPTSQAVEEGDLLFTAGKRLCVKGIWFVIEEVAGARLLLKAVGQSKNRAKMKAKLALQKT